MNEDQNYLDQCSIAAMNNPSGFTDEDLRGWTFEEYAEYAHSMAVAMLAERNKRMQPETKPAPDSDVHPSTEVVGPCICGSWPGGKCLKCPRIDAENWIDWNGGACPVPDSSTVRVQLRNGHATGSFADTFYWTKEDEPSDIVKYRVVK